jgi:uncharacterized membrane protein
MGILFRKTLCRELKEWVGEGVVSEEQAARLGERYRLDRLESEARGTLLNTIFLIGAVLIGCGVVAFVAAHWDDIPRTLKVALLLALMLGAHGAGFWLWHRRTNPRPHLGHALTLLGTLIFGANIGLFAQIYHISGSLHEAFLAWAVGAAVMAYALGSVPNAAVAAAASFIGYCLYMDTAQGAFFVYPVVAAHALFPLCYRRRSLPLLFLIVVAAAGSLVGNSWVLANGKGWQIAMPFLLTATALWCYGRFHHRKGAHPEFGALARALGALCFSGMLFFISFHEIADECSWMAVGDSVPKDGYWYALCVPLIVMAVLAAITVVRRPAGLLDWVVPLIAAAVVIGATFLPRPEIWSTIVFNAVALAIAGWGIAAGLREYERLPYWSGLAFAVALIAGRFFEYESHLLVKSAGFVAAGVILIVAGIAFENRMKKRGKEAAHA